jgi:WD40 repeat protein
MALCGGLSLRAEPAPNRRVLVLQGPPVVSVNSVAVSPDGSLVATAADGIRLYDGRTGVLLRVIGDAGDRGVAFSPDGRTVAAAGFHLEQPFSTPLLPLPIYDVQTGKRVQTLAGHTEWETGDLRRRLLARRQPVRLGGSGQTGPGVGSRDRPSPAPVRRPGLLGHRARLLTR